MLYMYMYVRHTSRRSHNDGQRRDDDKHNDFQPNRFGGGGRRWRALACIFGVQSNQCSWLHTQIIHW